MANLERGFIVGFKCCLDGRELKQKNDGTYENLDGENIGNKSWHPFLIISDTTKNNNVWTKYIHAVPITSSQSKFNQQWALPITPDMISSGGDILISTKSLLKVDSIVSIHKEDYDGNGIRATINPSTIPYKKILSEVIKKFGCNQII